MSPHAQTQNAGEEEAVRTQTNFADIPLFYLIFLEILFDVLCQGLTCYPYTLAR
mgnify:CR=1 FL=1